MPAGADDRSTTAGRARITGRALCVVLGMLFVDRAFYSLKVGRSDRAGFLDLGAAALERDFDPDPPINTYPPPFAVVMRPSRRRSTRWDLRYIAGFGALRSCWRWPFSPVILRRRSS